MFLMHRVELKAFRLLFKMFRTVLVPNAPCGVESLERSSYTDREKQVPNAPCGVERRNKTVDEKLQRACAVPNAPCGVESNPLRNLDKVLEGS